ncbi:hypothetical protein C7475_1224 [Chitinophaga sp. S165]|nr:hypothetical protein C7475_1224 [Chitinophaga sp. S165]
MNTVKFIIYLSQILCTFAQTLCQAPTWVTIAVMFLVAMRSTNVNIISLAYAAALA